MHSAMHAFNMQLATGVTAPSTEFTLIRLLVIPSLRQEIFGAFIKLLIYLFINFVSQVRFFFHGREAQRNFIELPDG